MLSARFQCALAYAAELHQDQLRKATEIPYISHLLSVAALALEDGGTEDEAIAALLHDALEDQGRDGQTRQEIEQRFGGRVLAIVIGCTDTEADPKPPWKPRKQAYLAHLRLERDQAIVRVSLADKLHNARSILADYRVFREQLWSRFNGGRDGTLWYYRALLDTYSELSSSPMVGELGRVLAELEQLALSETIPPRSRRP
jgi:(p)ppGpp synthase/HD superfamily hydrolase